MEKKTLVLVADVKGWAFDNIAQYLLKLLSHKYDIKIIYVSNFQDYDRFLDALNDISKIDFIHFFYRIYLRELLKHFMKNDPFTPKLQVLMNASVVTVIPDKMFLKEPDIIGNEDFFSFIDNYYSVSKELHEIYSNINIYPGPWRDIIYDNIIVKAEPDFTSNDKLQVTWVGNSAWGADYFGPDYDSKGFYTIVKPVLDRIEKEFSIGINIVDAASEKRSAKEVSEILQKTDILLIGAKGEGTPLPLIEAMASGCAIISSKVGIVPEVLPKEQQQFILERDADEFVKAILKLDNNRDLLAKLKKSNYAAYKKIFLDSKSFLEKWCDFIESSIARSNDRIKYKNNFLIIALINDLIYSKIKSPAIKKFLNFLVQYESVRNFIVSLYFMRRRAIGFIYKMKSLVTNVFSYIPKTYKKLFVTEENIFSKIYATDFWTQGSGPGSTKENTVEYRKMLQQYFDDPKYKTYIDLGCGDWQIMRLLNIPKEKIYKGYDIVKSVIDENHKKFSKDNVTFYHSVNIDDIDSGDFLIIKDVLMHWPNKRVQYFIDNVLPKFKYALITEAYDPVMQNTNIIFGEWRPVDLTAHPFNVKTIKHIGSYEVPEVVKKIYFYTNPNIK